MVSYHFLELGLAAISVFIAVVAVVSVTVDIISLRFVLFLHMWMPAHG